MRNRRYKHHIKCNGFTLMELVVVLGVFSITVLVLTEIFMTLNKTQRKVMEYQKLQSDASFTLEAIARAIRLGTIDYDVYSGAANNPENELYVLDYNGKQSVFKLGNNQAQGCLNEKSSPCVITVIDTDNDGIAETPGAITPKGVKITNLKFYITPAENPFLIKSCTLENQCLSGVCLDSGYCQVPSKQPMVTVSLATEQTDTANPEKIDLQTTVSSRQYYK